jgi:ATP-binding cassette subfamily F protein uup
MLARALAKPSNVLVLDEPTNDLDLETLDVLEEMLGDYAGTVILISHDRDFLDRVVSGVIVPEGNGRWQEYAGGYSDMLAQRGENLKALARESKAAAPKQPKAPSAREPKPNKRRLSFHEKHALDTLPKTISALEAKISALNARLHDPTLYTRDRPAFDTASAALAAAQSELATAEERWLELEILRNEIDGG